MIKDETQRRLATDPTQSFIVQAPAGSGKTEILGQRFLRLLATVQQPEHIVALTFTRKAASEMKERVLAALKKSKDGIVGDSAHQQHTLHLAQAALAHDHQHQWNILQHPHRLRIMTIDALCQRLSDAIPLFDKELPFAQITNSPQLLYQQAARACLRDAIHEPDLQPAIEALLGHLDNGQDRLITLFCDLLARREQWLDIVFLAKTLSQHDFEAALEDIEQHTLDRLLNSIPFQLQDEICSLSQQIAIIENNPDSPRYALRHWDSFDDFNRDYANGLAHLLLTQDDKLRRGFDHHVGLKKEIGPHYASLKQRSQLLCDSLKETSEFAAMLAQVKRLPEPFYTENQWQVLQALLTLLPLLVAELHLIFKQNNTLDFTQITQQALRALGDDDNPTDLTLYLDHTIHHLLIDEFQDTSIQQIQLVHQLVQNWLPDEGKTLFVVGDPMQSIYRFRQAEVGLFLKVRQEGLGPVVLKSLELTSNFRSTANIITWINTHFKFIFPHQEDIETGAISFHPSTAVLSETSSSWIKAQQFANKQDEARALTTIVTEQLQLFPEETVAILVRSRNQLIEIIRTLRQKNIAFQGVEINPLSQLSHLRDLWSLTKALLYPACRLSWLSLLRSPYCGLDLHDLQLIANVDSKKSIYNALKNLDEIKELSQEGKLRAQFVFQVLEHAIAHRHQQSLIDWIMATAEHLHAKHLIETHQHSELEQFWQLLEQHLDPGRFPDLDTLNQEFEKLYSKLSTPSRLHIMTIHKSKGLEFDCVIIPGIGSKSSPPDLPLIRWLKIPTPHHKEYLLVSPIKAAHEDESPLYNYLHHIESEKADYELQRLFYVATTRAKKRLYLLDNQERQNKGTFRHLLKHQDFMNQPEKQDSEQDNTLALPILSRLPIHFYSSPPTLPLATMNDVAPPSDLGFARQLGLISHELLQWICTYHPQTNDELPWKLVEQRGQQHGLNLEQRQSMLHLLQEQIKLMMTDPVGQWICQKHVDEKNEYALLTQQEERVKTRVIDRTFIDNGIRWIIDFKTGNDNENKQEQHKKQVNHYAQLLNLTETLPIYCGLYYLATNQWIPWQYTTLNKKRLVATPL